MRLASFAHLALRALSMINTQRRYDERTRRTIKNRKDKTLVEATIVTEAKEDTKDGWNKHV